MIRASSSQSVDLQFIPFFELYQKTLNNGIHSFPALRSSFRGGCGEQAGKFAVVSLGKALNGMLPPLCGRQVPQTPRKWPAEGNGKLLRSSAKKIS